EEGVQAEPGRKSERPVGIERHHQESDHGRHDRHDRQHLLDLYWGVALHHDTGLALTGYAGQYRRVDDDDVRHREEGRDPRNDLRPEIGTVLVEAEVVRERGRYRPTLALSTCRLFVTTCHNMLPYYLPA